MQTCVTMGLLVIGLFPLYLAFSRRSCPWTFLGLPSILWVLHPGFSLGSLGLSPDLPVLPSQGLSHWAQYFLLGRPSACALCFCALCPGVAQINTAAPNLIRQTNKLMRGRKQSDKISTHQTTRGNNGPSAPWSLPSLWVSLGLIPLWPLLLSSLPMFSLGLPLGLPWAFLGLFLAVSGLFVGRVGLWVLFPWSRRSLGPMAANTNTAVKTTDAGASTNNDSTQTTNDSTNVQTQ